MTTRRGCKPEPPPAPKPPAPPPADAQRITADRGDAGRRVDRVVSRHLPAVSRTRVQRLIEGGSILLNGALVARPSAKVKAGDAIDVAVPLRRRTVEAESADHLLDVLYEDEWCLALNKPAGLVVHPTFHHRTGTLLNALLSRSGAWPDRARPGLVGRLDKDTSGVILISKGALAHAALQRATAAGKAIKQYLAVVYGRVRETRGTIDVPLGPDPLDRRRTAAGAPGARPSVTRFERIGRANAPPVGLALLRCTLGSGRRHQIRAHLFARGWPIVGDPAYGRPRWAELGDGALKERLRSFSRQALHAERIAFVHPFTGARVEVGAPLPRDMQDLIDHVLGT